MRVVGVAHIPAHPRQQQHRHLAGETEHAQHSHRTGQLINEPLLRRGLHPRANQRDELSNDEKLKVAVLQGAKSCRQLWNWSLPTSSIRGSATSHHAATSRHLSTRGINVFPTKCLSEKLRAAGRRGRLKVHSFGGSGAPTCVWLRSRRVERSSSLRPRMKFGSFRR